MKETTRLSTPIHPDDDMFTGSLEHYTSVGQQLTDHVVAASRMLGQHAPPRVLELPCGYGRVTRHLVEAFPAHDIWASDIMVPAVAFVEAEFGVNGHPAVAPFNELTGLENQTFDLAVMGSLVTHLSAANASTLLRHLFRVIKPGGVAIVTTHGLRSRQLVAEGDIYQVGKSARQHLCDQFDQDRFGFVNYLPDHTFEAKTVDYIGDSYGISLIPDRWMSEVAESNGMDIVKKQAGGWDDHQDIYFLRKR